MIRKCSKYDLELLNNYLYKNKEINLFLISDIENYGFENENLDIFIDIDNEIKTIYLRFFNNLCIVSYDLIIEYDFLLKLIKDYEVVNINGDKKVIENINLSSFVRNDFYFATLNKLKIEQNIENVIEIKSDRVDEYLEKVKMVFQTESNIETIKSELEKKSMHINAYTINNEIVSGASSSAESNELSMLIGVFTIEEYRRKGYAQKCVYSLCKRLIAEKKCVCLFYDNPNAAKMYKKIGFEDIGFYSILKKINK